MTIFLFLLMIVNIGQRTRYDLGWAPDTGNSWNNYKSFIKCKDPITLFILSPWSSAIRKIDTRTGDMDKLPDEILLRIFSFIHFTERIILRTVCWRWSSLLYDPSLLENISIANPYCADRQLTSLFAASKRLIAVDFFNSRSLNGSCILLAGLSRLRHLTLTGTGITDRILSSILQASSELVELHLAGTQISELCVPHIIGLGKLRYIAVPPEDVCGFSKRGVLAIVQGCPSLRTLDCQEGYFFVKEEITEIVSNNCQLTGLIIPYAFIDDNMCMFVIESLRNLKHICVCETSVTQACVDRVKSRKPCLDICWRANHSPWHFSSGHI